MRVVIAAVGKLKDGAERELYARYAVRLTAVSRQAALGPIDLIELPESRAPNAADRQADEATRLLSAVSKVEVLVALDENGQQYTSPAFARLLRKSSDQGRASIAFLVGGADGHGAPVLNKVDLKLSLSSMTLPHGLARVVLAEQLYRAATIVTGHPYHRA
ncbi:MAG: 23S rRNA (pseudouridine(1915)-N(3))-methyltransferase RlmH [Hyphomicrobium sp.]